MKDLFEEILYLAGCENINEEIEEEQNNEINIKIDKKVLNDLKIIYTGLLNDFNKLKQLNKSIITESILTPHNKVIDDSILSYIQKILSLIDDLSIKEKYSQTDKKSYKDLVEFLCGYVDYIRYITMLYFIVPHSEDINDIIWDTDKNNNTLVYVYKINGNYLKYLPTYLIKTIRYLCNYYKGNSEIEIFEQTVNKTIQVTWVYGEIVSVNIRNVEDGFNVTFNGAYGGGKKYKSPKTFIQFFIECQFIEESSCNSKVFYDIVSEFNYYYKRKNI